MCENGLFNTELLLDKTAQREKMTEPPSMRPAPFLISLVGVLLFWGGIVMAKRLYHGEFDWRYMTLSTLLSPRRNPTGYLWAAGGVVLSSVCALCWAVALRSDDGEGTAQRPGGLLLLIAGSICMAGSVLLPWWDLVRK